MTFIVQDIKTDRPNISGGLPASYRMVPLAFYSSALMALAMNLFLYTSLRKYQRDEKIWLSQVAEAESEKLAIEQKQSQVIDEAHAAERIADWVEGSRPVQPLGATISRSMQATATIAELTLDRNPQMPAHLFMTLKLNNAGSEQLEATLDSLAALDFQTYSAQQVKTENALDFQATLIWNKSE
jgi:hypothetical protein